MKPLFRLIVDPPCSASLNMARDEFLLLNQKNEGAHPVLRFTTWSGPAYSAGYFQDIKIISKRLGCDTNNIPIVRRLTGGGLVKHGDDLTFSLALKYPNSFFSAKDVKDSYLKVNMAILRGLKNDFSGLDYADCKSIPSGRADSERHCFEAPTCYDLLWQDKKVVGASQRRSAGVILHQSSVYLPKDKNHLIEKICQGFEAEWKISFEKKNWNGEETEAVKEIEASRYRSWEWALPPVLESSFLS